MFVYHSVTMRAPLLPMWGIALVYLTSSVVFLHYRTGSWARYARPFFRSALLGGVFWIEFALWLGAPTAHQAALWYLPNLPLLLLYITSMSESLYVVYGRAVWPRLWPSIYIIGGLGLLVTIGLTLFGHTIPMGRSLDNFYNIPQHPPLWLTLSELLTYAGSFTGFLLPSFYFIRTPHERAFRTYAFLSLASIPIYLNDVLGVRYFVTPYPLSWIASIFWITIFWIELGGQIQATQERLQYDANTHAISRGYGEILLQSLLSKQPVGIIYLDVDHFKRVNDTFGHHVGDQVLQAVVQRARAICRSEDAVVRLGGDEFVICLPGVDSADQDAIMARFNQGFHTPAILAKSDDHVLMQPITLSLGWTWASRGTSVDRALHYGDTAMYVIKAQHHQTQSS